MKRYLEEYNNQLDALSHTLFDGQQRKDWFNKLKNLTKYNCFEKRDGSIATSCWVNGSICTGRWFAHEVKKWYTGIAYQGPKLSPSEFP